jgi:hypothetical protein
MEEKPDYEKDLASIRNIMERSVKFISLSGLAGIMAGIYALAAASYAYYQIYLGEISRPREFFEFYPYRVYQLIILGVITLVASLATGWYFSFRKAKRINATIWNSTSKRLVINLFIPLSAGGIFALVTLYHGYFGLAGPICLIFYGLALINASQNLFDEIRYLGYCEIILGLLSSYFIGYGLIFWAVGFGLLHIIYGVMMYRKYDA